MTNLIMRVNYVDADLSYDDTGAGYIVVDLTNDYLIWTAGSDAVIDLMTHEPTSAELNEASTIIEDIDTMVPLCLLLDYSHNVGGAYYTHTVKGMGENKQFVFNFSFDGNTASEPRLEAWDDSSHTSINAHVLGNATPANSMVKAKATSYALPGAGWPGTPIAGASNYILLNAGLGAIELATGETSKELYVNIKIVIPANYPIPAVETFVLTIRYTWN